MTGWRRYGRLLIAAGIVLAVAALAFWPDAVEVDVTPVVRGPLAVTVDEEGETRVRDRFVVSAPVAGRLDRVELEPGDPVQAGQTIVARLRPTDPALLDARARAELNAAVASAESAVGTARAERDRARSTLERARASFQRARQLHGTGLLSADEYEMRETAVRTAEDSLEAAEFSLNRARHELEMGRARLSGASGGGGPIDIRAPVEGVVLRRFRESEAVVPSGEPLVEIGDPSELEIVADFLSSEAVRIGAGDAVIIDQWGGGEPLRGRVRLVEPSGFMKVSALGVEEQRVNVVIDFEDAAAAARLGDGYRVEVQVVVWKADGVVKVPVGALFRHEGMWAVFVLEDGRARVRRVELGHRNDTEAEGLDGLTEGELVIVHPPDTLADRARATPRS